MKIYLFVDMEGISGISNSEFVRTDGRHYQTARKYYTWDINACVAGCFAAGADAVLVRDGHSSSDHALWNEIDPRAELIQGNTGDQRMPGLTECAGLILLGYHAMAGTPGAVMEHTYSSAGIQNMWLNGRLAGEFAIDAALAADYGVPTIMVSGDDKVCREAQTWIPEVVTCQVKVGLSCQGARLLPLPVAHQRITEATAEAVRKLGSIPLMPFDHPVTLRKEVIERGVIPQATARPEVTIIDGRTIEVTADRMQDALARIF